MIPQAYQAFPCRKAVSSLAGGGERLQQTMLSAGHGFLVLVYLCELCPDGPEKGIKIKDNLLGSELAF